MTHFIEFCVIFLSILLIEDYVAPCSEIENDLWDIVSFLDDFSDLIKAREVMKSQKISTNLVDFWKEKLQASEIFQEKFLSITSNIEHYFDYPNNVLKTDRTSSVEFYENGLVNMTVTYPYGGYSTLKLVFQGILGIMNL